MTSTPSATFDLATLPDAATLRSVTATPVELDGRRVLRVSLTDEITREGRPGVDFVDQPTFVRLPLDFRDGTIEVDVRSRVRPDASEDARGFAGLTYRIVGGGERFESVYLRPANGRRHDPPSPRHERSVQYFAFPEYPFDRLRAEYPDGRFEAGADIGLDTWTNLRLEVEGSQVTAFVDGQQVLQVARTKAEPVTGHVGLFVDIGTEAFFSRLAVTHR